ncbi:MAG: 2'-5' RNA ligase family protein, partial [Actinomycetota bacterium]|nr:2'-5' RNA ligase family protein [Actinomycetota bacterium]
MPKARLGVALLLPPAVAAEVDGLRRALGDGALGRIAPHVTLVPPVNVAAARMGDALAVLRRAASACRPLTLALGPAATFLPATPVVYLAVGGAPDAVAGVRALRDAVFSEPLSRPLTWPWVPHVTLADDADPARIPAAVAALADYRVVVRIDRVHLLREGPGRVWEPLADAPFAAPSVVGRGGLALELSVTDRLDPEGAALVADDRRPFAVSARRDGVVVGVARGATAAEEAELAALAVAAAERGQGIGSRLLAEVE